MTNIVSIKGARSAPKAVRSTMDTIFVTAAEIGAWKLPPFQRPLRVNEKVRAMAEELKNDEVMTGVLTLGKIKGAPAIFIVDGQHRLEAFKISGLAQVIADVRICEFDTIGEMASEFVRLNSSLVRMRPDDVLRGMESAVPALQRIRKECEFVGYDQIRRSGASSAVLGMSAVVRSWASSAGETPTGNLAGQSVGHAAEAMDAASTQDLILFLLTAHAAWGRDPQYFRLWGNLNLTVCMWLWRRLVLDRSRTGNNRVAVLSVAQFKQCLMSVSANGNYVDWLQGRVMSDRDRGPCYERVKAIFVRRLIDESKDKRTPRLPKPAWSSG